MKIEIDGDPFATDYWYSGSYIKDIGFGEEYKEEIYEFTLHDADSDVTTLTWTENTPDDAEIIEKEIINKYQSR